jgi:hypothetical protein
MTTTPVSVQVILPAALTVMQFQALADAPPEIEWFANLTNANTRRPPGEGAPGGAAHSHAARPV